MSRSILKFAAVMVLNVFLALSSAEAGKGHDKNKGKGKDRDKMECKQVKGEFYSTLVYDETCLSPVLICTDGTLLGKLKSSYEFTMDTLAPIDPMNNPALFGYTGASILTLIKGDHDQIFGDDTGVLTYNPTSPSPFTATLSVSGGTGKYEEAEGSLVIIGAINFMDGTGSGIYKGTICVDKRNGHGNDHDDDDCDDDDHNHGHH